MAMDDISDRFAQPGGCFSVPPLPQGHGERGDKEPKNSRLRQQALPACKPVMDTIWVVFIYLSAGVVLIPIGAVCLAYGQQPVEVSYRYDQTCFPANQSFVFSNSSNYDRQQYIWQNAGDDEALSCTLTLTIADDMPTPLYVFYEMKGFLQNHRRYVISRSDQQLVDKSDPNTDACTTQLDYAGNSSQAINPCGLAAWTYFNDTYQDWQVLRNGEIINQNSNLVSTNDIAPKTDQKYMFADYIPQFFNPLINRLRGGSNITTLVKKDQHFIIWMRLAPLPSFRKLWGIINDQELLPGDQLQLTVTNRYNSFGFDGKKSIVVSSATWLGSRNPFMGIVFLITGCLFVTAGVMYLVVAVWIRPRKFGDLSVLYDGSEWTR